MRMSMPRFERPLKHRPKKTLAPGDHKATVIAVAAQKGGVGKTTTAVTLACAWGRFHGKRVLVVDLDPQSHVSLALRSEIEVGGSPLSELMESPEGKEVAQLATHTRIPGVQVTPPDPGLLHTETRISSRIGKELVLKKALEISRTHFDLIVLDCPPNVGCLTVNALVAADYVLIPCNPTALAVSGVAGLVEAIETVSEQLNPDLGLLGVLLTRMDGRNSRTNDAVLALLEESWGEDLLPVRVGVSNALPAAQLAGEDVFVHDPGCRGAQQYQELAGLLLERIAEG